MKQKNNEPVMVILSQHAHIDPKTGVPELPDMQRRYSLLTG